MSALLATSLILNLYYIGANAGHEIQACFYIHVKGRGVGIIYHKNDQTNIMYTIYFIIINFELIIKCLFSSKSKYAIRICRYE